MACYLQNKVLPKNRANVADEPSHDILPNSETVLAYFSITPIPL